MGLLLLTLLGAVFGWLVSVVLQEEVQDNILRNIGAGVLGALAVGATASSASLLLGISGQALLLALAGALVAIALANAIKIVT